MVIGIQCWQWIKCQCIIISDISVFYFVFYVLRDVDMGSEIELN